MTKHDPFIMLPHTIYDSPIFAALKPIHIAVLLLLIRKYNGHNNTAIALGIREAARRCHCSQATACRALARLQDDGLISVTYKGHLVPEVGRPDAATRWRLNFLPESRPMNPTSPRAERFPNETSGCFPGETSPGPAVRFSSETSSRASPVKQSIDNLTRAKPRRVRKKERGDGLAGSPGNDPASPLMAEPRPPETNQLLVSPTASIKRRDLR